MHVVLGATGHLGSAVARSLLAPGEPVTVVTRSADKASRWEADGATAVVLDVHDAEALRAALPDGGRVFALNPPADPTAVTPTPRRTAPVTLSPPRSAAPTSSASSPCPPMALSRGSGSATSARSSPSSGPSRTWTSRSRSSASPTS
ncbi:SDR family oxidoreductase [Lapillicoccus sp.]|uniref:SDR family oxidoreductase n=1 Tax=Lapillicoccus sp. TaxID=1909287 RepID=UPI0039C95266